MEILYPFPYSIHSNANEMDFSVTHWGMTCGLLPDKGSVNAVRSNRINYFAAYLFPHADSARLVHIAKLFLMLFLQDDQAEKLSPISAFRWLKSLLAGTEKIERNHQLKFGPKQDPFLEAYKCYWMDFFQALDPSSLSVYRQCLQDYWQGQLWEAQHKIEGKLPEISEYLIRRRMSSGSGIAIFFLRWLHGRLEDGTDMDCRFRLAEIFAANAICLANDLGSMDKELASGENNSYPILLIHGFRLSKESAVEKTKMLHDRNVKNLLALIRQSRETAELLELRYFDALLQMVAGSNAWSRLETNRYHNKKNGMVFSGDSSTQKDQP